MILADRPGMGSGFVDPGETVDGGEEPLFGQELVDRRKAPCRRSFCRPGRSGLETFAACRCRRQDGHKGGRKQAGRRGRDSGDSIWFIVFIEAMNPVHSGRIDRTARGMGYGICRERDFIELEWRRFSCAVQSIT